MGLVTYTFGQLHMFYLVWEVANFWQPLNSNMWATKSAM